MEDSKISQYNIYLETYKNIGQLARSLIMLRDTRIAIGLKIHIYIHALLSITQYTE